MTEELCKVCDRDPIEWADTFCQDCWEKYCSREWWAMIDRIQPTDGET